MKLPLRLALLILWFLSGSPAAAQVLGYSPSPTGDQEARLVTPAQRISPRFPSDLAPLPAGDPAAFSSRQYLGMFAVGTLGSAVGLLAGLVGGAAVTVVGTGCIGCGGGIPPLVYLIPAATTSFATAAAVTSVARPPTSLEFGPGLREVLRSDVFRPALVGAVAGIATGVLLGLAVDQVSPPDQPYGLVAFNIGQSAASVLAVRIWTARRHP
ncbi:MAG: hypothetical protein M3P51_09405 [Chloroflexota bacterium]|nr:hypothetical protein [Chloroflexota bacterium]